MRIPAIKARSGDRDFYIGSLTFEQVSQYVVRIDESLYRSEGLKDILQRSLTNNYIGIKNYIINQNEHFFNSLVLAVYDDYPDWREISVKYDDEEIYEIGILEFPVSHKIFPVDGQHRVEGIKEALKENAALKNERIGVIFIGHENTDLGKQRTRRLFTTLNRYAKPVSLDDIIALDEDDCVAISTRYLLENYDLFTDKKVIYASQKAIPPTNKDAITSIITLYQANIEILRLFFERKRNIKLKQKTLGEFLKKRPSEETLSEYKDFLITTWDVFKNKMDAVRSFLDVNDISTENIRNNETGGNLIFRPIGFLPLVKCAIEISRRTDEDFETIFTVFNNMNFTLNVAPWVNVLWNDIEKKMLTSADTITFLLLLYKYNPQLLSVKELKNLKEGYASKLSAAEEDVNNILDNI